MREAVLLRLFMDFKRNKQDNAAVLQLGQCIATYKSLMANDRVIGSVDQ